MLIAHRGVHNNIDIPENSCLGFKKALELNLPIELDIHLTKDSKLVVFHDKSLLRMTEIDKNIEDLTYNELKEITLLNTHENIPLFKDVLNLVDGKVLLDIEVKTTKRVKEISKLLSNSLKQYNGEVLIKSFDPRIIKCLRKINSSYTYGLLLKSNYGSKIYNLIMKNNLIIKYCKPNFLAIYKKLVKTKRIKKLRKKYPIYIWTIMNQNEIEKYKNYCDVYICNNLPFQKENKPL